MQEHIDSSIELDDCFGAEMIFDNNIQQKETSIWAKFCGSYWPELRLSNKLFLKHVENQNFDIGMLCLDEFKYILCNCSFSEH